MKTFALVNSYGVSGWYEVIEEVDSETLERLASRFSETMAKQYISGRKGLNHENMGRFLWEYIENIQTYIREGRKLLINRLGGVMFLDNSVEVLKVVRNYSFPVKYEKGIGLNGWLTPNGVFHHCEHGEHWIFADDFMNGNSDNLREQQYVSISSAGKEFKLLSTLFIPTDGFTPEQSVWLEKHYHYLDEEQKRLFDSTKERIDM